MVYMTKGEKSGIPDWVVGTMAESFHPWGRWSWVQATTPRKGFFDNKILGQ